MKKTISIVLALAMVLVLSVSAFAAVGKINAPKPAKADSVQGWTVYYTELLKHADKDTQQVISMIATDVNSGAVNREVASAVIPVAIQKSGLSNDKAQAVVNGLNASIAEGFAFPSLPDDISLPFPDVSFPDWSLPDWSLPDGSLPDWSLPEVSFPDLTLPSDFDPALTLPGGDEEGGGFLDTILGILGGIIDGIFGGGGDEDPTTPPSDDDGNGWGDDDDDIWGSTDDDTEITSGGDTTVFAVATVAAVAGAALVLTRKKKNDDAE